MGGYNCNVHKVTTVQFPAAFGSRRNANQGYLELLRQPSTFTPLGGYMPSTPMADCTTLQDIEVGENACSVEYCPVAGLGTYVACSTYALETFCGGHQTNPSSGEDGELETATAVVQIDPEDDSHPGVDTSTTNITDAASGIVPGTEGSSSVVRQTRTGSVAVYKVSCVFVSKIPAGTPLHLSKIFQRSQVFW